MKFGIKSSITAEKEKMRGILYIINIIDVTSS